MIELILALLLQLFASQNDANTKDKKGKDSDVATAQSFSDESSTAASPTEPTNTTQYGGTSGWIPK